MADNINVEPTPIQRNRRDVAVELVKLFVERGQYNRDDITEDKISELYKKYFKVALEMDKL